MKDMEIRLMPMEISSNDEGMVVEGLVNETGKLSHVLGLRKKFREKISKGAFERSLSRSGKIDFLSEHDEKMLLASTSNGSLELFEDEQGLKMRAKIAPTSYGKDVYTLMKEGMIGNMSFGFRVISDKWKKLANGTYERTIDDLDLFEVSAVRNPAYPQSIISARGINIVEDIEIPNEVEEEVTEMEKEKTEVNEDLTVEDFRSLYETCKNLVEEVRNLKETIEKNNEQEEVVEEVEQVEETGQKETVEEEKEDKTDVKEKEVEETENKEEERSVNLSAYQERLKNLNITNSEEK